MKLLSNEEFNNKILQVVPKELLDKHGWVILATPVIGCAIVLLHDLAKTAIDNDRELNVELMSFKLSIR